LRLLTAAVAHEVNEPLSAILLNASTCLRTLSSDRPNIAIARETPRATLRDVERAAGIIQRFACALRT
jgi:hypothetical protein